jgi:hypothetical protein
MVACGLDGADHGVSSGDGTGITREGGPRTGEPGGEETGEGTEPEVDPGGGGPTIDPGTGGGEEGGGEEGGGEEGGGEEGGGEEGGGGAVSLPGGPCGCDNDCGAVGSYPGICVYGICMTRASTDCSAGGSATECGAGSLCWNLQGDDRPICWPSCDDYSCDGVCDEDNVCSPTEGMDCDSACGAHCAGTDGGSGGGGDSSIGAACLEDEDCGAAVCQPDDSNGFVNGYCLAACGTPGAACASGAICVADLAGEGNNICMQTCDAGCRDGYECMSYSGETFCYPYCEAASDCPGGYTCGVDNFCIEGSPCSADSPTGFCDGDRTCVDGSCSNNCSADHTRGFCPEGFECDAGNCMSTSGCGNWRCTGSNCQDIIAMPGSRNPTSAEARADGYYVAHEARYSYLRRDLTMLIQWAACEVRAANPGVAPLGLGDLSQADGFTPGVDDGRPRHMESTHRGNDMDIAYYQTDGANNLQIICGDGSDTNGNGPGGRYNDGEFCTTNTNIVDFSQTALFMALMAVNPDFRVVGVDETLPARLVGEFNELRSAGTITSAQRDRLRNLGYGADGYWQFHHHHLHFSYD